MMRPAAALIIPALLFLLLAYAIPLFYLTSKSVITPSGFTLDAYKRYLLDPYSWQVISNSLSTSLKITFFCIIVGYPVALQMVLLSRRVFPFVLVALILPISLSVIVKAFAWQIVLGRSGVINKTLLSVGVIDEPLRLLFTETGLILGSANIFLPFMVLPIYAVAKQIDPRLWDAASTLGAGSFYRFRTVTLPLTLPGLVAGFSVVFSLSISMYVIPTLLIGDRFQTLATQLGRFYLTIRDDEQGAVVAVLLLFIAVTVVMVTSMLATPRKSSS